MTRPTLLPFKAEHLMLFQNRDTWTQEGWRLAFEKERGGPAFTAIAGDTILACGGIMVVWPGVGGAWMALSDAVNGHDLWLTRMVRRVIEDATRAYGLHRLEAVVRADNGRNARWIEALGFSRENGAARAYTPDRVDAIRYELVRLEVGAQVPPGAAISGQDIAE